VQLIKRFSGKYNFLSNFYPCEIIYENIKYPSVEHAYQASKTLDIKLKKEIANKKTPDLAKKLGNKIELRKDWDSIKLNIMETLIRQKFRNHKDLRIKLLETDNAELIEGNTWGDTFWGIYKGRGENHLGKILMKIRDEIKNEVKNEVRNENK